MLSGGRLYGGSADRLAAGAESAVEFLSSPIQNTRDHFDEMDAEFEALRQQGRDYEAGDLAAQGSTDILGAATMVTGAGSLGTSMEKLGGRAARNSAVQLGREVTGSPTVYYLKESTNDFVLNLWRSETEPRRPSLNANVDLRVMLGPDASKRNSGARGRNESLDESLRRQLGQPNREDLLYETREAAGYPVFDQIQRARAAADARDARASTFDAASEGIQWLRALGRAFMDNGES